jgi:NAD(P)-dependent dehydrogenase (short-subunit alcohol dehydrogenase family)
MKDKQVLLTGGTGGLGLGVTPTIVVTGARVIIPYHSESGISRLKERMPATDFDRIVFVKTNLNDESAVEKLVNDIGRVDVLIHLVGGFSMGRTDEFSFQDWKDSFDLNLHSTFLVCKHCLRVMRKHGYGRIVTIASRGALQPGAQLAAYSASKAGVVALTQAIAQETKNLDITANVVLPSVIDTPSNRDVMGEAQANEWVKPESIAEVISFLASDAARDVRGAAIPVYGSL